MTIEEFKNAQLTLILFGEIIIISASTGLLIYAITSLIEWRENKINKKSDKHEHQSQKDEL